jgi:Flp pilus assembly protein TadG
MMASICRCERGNSFVELAFVAPMLVTLLLGMVDISRAVSAKLQVVQVSQRTIERVQRSGFVYADIATLEAEAEAAAGTGSNAIVTAWLECGSSANQLSFTTGTCTAGEPYARFVGISVTKPFTPLFVPEYFTSGTTLGGSAGVRIQ